MRDVTTTCPRFPRKSYGQRSLRFSFEPFSHFMNTHSVVTDTSETPSTQENIEIRCIKHVYTTMGVFFFCFKVLINFHETTVFPLFKKDKDYDLSAFLFL